MSLLLWMPLAAFAQPGAVPLAFEDQPGFWREGTFWRLEATLKGTQPQASLAVGLVAEGEEGEDPLLPWCWVQVQRQGEEVLAQRIELMTDGISHVYINLDPTQEEDQAYATFTLGASGKALLEGLRAAQTLEVTVHWPGQQQAFGFQADQLADLRLFAQAVLDADYFAQLDPFALDYADNLYHGPTVEKRMPLTGNTWQEQLQPLLGYYHEPEDGTWRYESFLYHQDDTDELMVGMVLEGLDGAEAYVPWMYLELIRRQEPLYPYQLKLTVDGRTFTYQKLNQEEGFVVWSLGQHGQTLVDALAQARQVKAKVYHGLGVDVYPFQGSSLAAARAWAQAMKELRVFAAFDISLLMQADIQHIVRVEDTGP